jgi:hypothetical protein
MVAVTPCPETSAGIVAMTAIKKINAMARPRRSSPKFFVSIADPLHL